MPFSIQICFIILLFLLNIGGYIFTFFDSFALKNKEAYDIISIFNDFVFIGCFLSALSTLKKTKIQPTIIFLLIPLSYTLVLILNFR